MKSLHETQVQDEQEKKEYMRIHGKTIRGFTLIELLVVIAIISLLVSILIPSLQKAKDLAKRAVCASNWHNIGLLAPMYQNDYSGKMFPNTSIHDTKAVWDYRSNPNQWCNFGSLFHYALDNIDPNDATSLFVLFNQAPVGEPPEDLQKYLGIFFDPAGPPLLNAAELNINYILPYTCPDGVPPWGPTASTSTTPWPSNNYDESPAVTAMGVCAVWGYDHSPYISNNHNQAGVNILFLDGHVSWKDTSEFTDCGLMYPDKWSGYKEAFNE